MSTITTIAGGDSITSSRTVLNTNFGNLNTDKIETSVLDTDTALAANSDSKIATQKAVKAYVDAGGNVNASETTKGIVEEATDAEVAAGTATGATGAKLFVTPAKLATRLTSITAFQQAIPCLSTLNEGAACSSDGSTFFLIRNQTAMTRYAKNTLTGMYEETHSFASSGAASGSKGMIVIGSYLYKFYSTGTVVACYRYLAADLTGETLMTVPSLSVAANAAVAAWTDGTSAYIVSSSSPTVSNKWTLSGTTFSASTTATVTTGIFANSSSASMWDGTNAYIIDNSISTTAVTVRKITTIDGSAYTTTSFRLGVISGVDTGAIGIPIGSNMMYIGKVSNNFNATADVSSTINLFPVTKP